MTQIDLVFFPKGVFGSPVLGCAGYQAIAAQFSSKTAENLNLGKCFQAWEHYMAVIKCHETRHGSWEKACNPELVDFAAKKLS